MKTDMVKLLFTYGTTVLILAGGFYALVIYPLTLEDLVKGAIIGFMGMAINFLYGEQVATRTGRQMAAATLASVNTLPPAAPPPPAEGG